MKTFQEFINESIIDKMTSKSDEDIIKSLDKLSDTLKIISIIEYKLPYDLLPDNLVINGALYCQNNQLTKLPDNLTIIGDLICRDNLLTELPKNLIVKGDLICKNNQLASLPDVLIVGGNLDCRYNPLPKDIKKPLGVEGNLII